MRKAALALTLALLVASACSSSREATSCTGPAFPLNAGLWIPADGEISR